MSEEIVYDEQKYSLEQVRELADQGVKILCPICTSELIVALTKEAAIQQHVHGGLFCPVSDNHVLVLVEFSADLNAVRAVITPNDTSLSDLDDLWS